MAELKTKATDASVTKFLNGVKDKKRRQDCETILKMMRKATRAEPKMWGSSIVGFGDCHYVYASGREGDWFLTGFSPRTQNRPIAENIHSSIPNGWIPVPKSLQLSARSCSGDFLRYIHGHASLGFHHHLPSIAVRGSSTMDLQTTSARIILCHKGR